MSWINDFQKLPVTIRNITLSLAGNIPFWLVAIYMLKQDFYAYKDYIAIFAFVLCFSITWYFLNLLSSLLAIHIIENNIHDEISDSDDIDTGEIAQISAGIVSILYLCIAILIAYFWDLSFTKFLIIAYSYVIFNIIIYLIIRKGETKNGDQ
jgi:hypothetical protein